MNYLYNYVRSTLSLGTPLFAVLLTTTFAFGAAQLEIKPITWDVIGLDSNKVTDGPDTFPVGARVCNTGDEAATNVTGTLVWDSANTYISLSPTGVNPLSLSSLPFGTGFHDIGGTGPTPSHCSDFYWTVIVTRNSAAYDTTRSYHIEATADTLGTISTPANRQLYVEKLVSQNRNAVDSVSGPTTVFVGQTYQYTMVGNTATQGYEQVVTFVNLPNVIFQILSVEAVYSAPSAGTTNNATYADACGWDPDSSHPPPPGGTYRSCIGPENYSGGKAGGDISITYTVKILSAGTASLTALIYDFSGSSYHYNDDFGLDVLAVTAFDPADLSVSKADSPDPVVAGGTLTYTLAVNNAGAGAAANVSVEDTLPVGVTFVSASGTGWTCGEAAGVVTCTRASLAVGDAPDITVTVTAPNEATTLNNSVSVSSDTADPNGSNDSDSEDTTVTASADLSVSKSDSPDPVGVGGTLTYTVSVSNAGPSTATNLSVSDTLPAGVSFVSASGTGWSCGEAAGVVTCTRASLAVGSAPDITINVTAPASGGTLTNSVSVSSDTADNNSSNDSDTEDTAVTGSADLSVTKSDSADPVVAGEALTYTLSVSNAGPSSAANLEVTDTLPAGVTFVSASGTGWSCGEAAGVVTCTRATLAVGSAPDITIEITTGPAASTITNTVQVTSDTSDPDTGDNSDSEDTTTTPLADLLITKTGPVSATSGSTLTYTLVVENLGPSDAADLSITDPTPSGLTFSSAEAPCAGGFPCAVAGSFPVGSTLSIEVTFSVPGGYSGPDPILNTASVASSTPDPDSSNNADQTSTPVDRAGDADLSVGKSGPVSAALGSSVTYTLVVTNNGPEDAQDVSLADPTPAGLTFVAATAPCQTGFPCSLGTLNSGDSIPVEVTFGIPAGYSGADPIVNTATVSTSTNDPDSSDDSATETTPLGSDTLDLSVSKTGPVQTTPGQQITFDIEVTNTGPADATGVSLADPTPAGLTFISADAPCAAGFPCSLGNLSAASSVNLQVTFDVPAGYSGADPILNAASVSSNETDVDPDNNSSTAAVGIAGEAVDLSVQKTGPAQAVRGDQVTYTLTVRNQGPGTAGAVTLSDPTPAGLTFVSASSPCAAGLVSPPCALGTLAQGSSVTVSVTFLIPVDYAGADPITNTATVATSSSDSNSSNDSDSALTSLDAGADLSVTKSDSADPVVAGAALTYTLSVSNAGPSTAANLEVTDTLPAGVTFVSASGTGWSCGEAAGVVTCTRATLAVGSAPDITIEITTGPAASTITNTVQVTSDTSDPDTGDNSDSEDTTTTPLADLLITKTGPVSATSGSTLTYTLVVENLGPSDAADLSITDPTPSGLTFSSAEAPCAGGFPCAVAGSFPVGSTLSIEVTFSVPGGYSGPDPILNTASVASSTPDPDSSNNADQTSTPVDRAGDADLSVGKSGPVSAALGSSVTYTLVVTNNGPEDAQDVSLADPTPAGLTFVAATAPCQTGFPCSLGTLNSGDSIPVEVTFGIPAGYSGADPIVNTATVSTSTNDPDSSDDSATETTPLGSDTLDLSVSKTGPVQTTPGQQITFDIEVTNTGPADATGVSLADPTPAGLTFISADAPCAAGFPCSLGNLSAASSVNLQVTFDVPAGYSGADPILNAASVSSNETDVDPDNNSSTAAVGIAGEAVDLSVQKTGPAQAVRGDQVTYTLTVRNQGPGTAGAVTLSDPTPAGLTFVSASSPCAAGLVSPPCALGTLAQGSLVTVSVTFLIPVDYAGADPITNTATVATSSSDSNSSNDSDSALTSLDAGADLSVTKSDSADPVVAGEALTYTLSVSNAGPSSATNLELTDTLPAGVTFVSASGTGWSCGEAAGVVTCTRAALAVGAAPDITITVTAPAQATTLTNSVQVTSDILDPDDTNNSDSEDTTVQARDQDPVSIPLLADFGIWFLTVLLGLAGYLSLSWRRRSGSETTTSY